MQITWAQNPLETSIEVTETEKIFMYYGYLYDRYLWNIEILDPEESMFQTRISEVLESEQETIDFYVNELKNGVHSGDCVTLACSCVKCRAEELIGVFTLKGLGTSSAYKIREAFMQEDVNTAEDAVDFLRLKPEYIRPETWPSRLDYDSHIPRWEREREAAVKWMEKYIKEKLS